MPVYSHSLCWFRRDLRLYDHAALYHALKDSAAVTCVFVFDTDILDQLTQRQDRRVEFIWHSVRELKQRLEQQGSTLRVLHGRAQQLIPQLAQELGVQAVFCNHDYEPEADRRDSAVAALLENQGIAFHHTKDQVIFERDEILTAAGRPFSVFTPYKNAWLKKLDEIHVQAYPVEEHLAALVRCAAAPHRLYRRWVSWRMSPLVQSCRRANPVPIFCSKRLCRAWRNIMRHATFRQ